MSPVSRKPSPSRSVRLADFIQSRLEADKLSLRKAAKGIGIAPSHLSSILNGEKTPDAGVCNAIADFLCIPRVQAYGLAGWLDLGEQDDQELDTQLSSLADSPEQLKKLKWIYFSIGDRAAREDFLKWVQKR